MVVMAIMAQRWIVVTTFGFCYNLCHTVNWAIAWFVLQYLLVHWAGILLLLVTLFHF